MSHGIFNLTVRLSCPTVPQVSRIPKRLAFVWTGASRNEEKSPQGEASALAAPATRMATTLAPVDSREVVRCDHCQLVQFRTNSNNCRRCRKSLEEDEPVPILMPIPIAPEEAPSSPRSELQVASSIRALRQRAGLSQRQLATRMNVPRTYVSKIENDKAMPTLSSLERLARALGVGIPDLLHSPATRTESRDLLADPFLQLLLPDLLKLDGMQRSMVLNQIREMATGRRRSA